MAAQYFAASSNSGNVFAMYGAAQSPRDTQSDIRSIMRQNGSAPSSSSSRDSSSASIASDASSRKGKNIRGTLKNVFA
ncbi:hypothetical protein BDV93DRAFT_518774 [Ceratobasidium sp. AG-I]|nr:hypothetical protein BDV93DRAFT_518774 [Ceratobasidium sp. AG-I]